MKVTPPPPRQTLLCESDEFPQLHNYIHICKSILQSKDSVLIFGAGFNGRYAFKEISRLGIPVEAFLDNNPEVQGTTVCGKQVQSPQNYFGSEKTVVIAVLSGYIEIKKQLDNLHIKNVVPHAALLDSKTPQTTLPDLMALSDEGNTVSNNIMEFMTLCNRLKRHPELFTEQKHDDFELSILDFVITERCSLKCRDCSNLMQYYQEPKSIPIDELSKAFNNLYKTVDYIYELNLYGGEPFLEKNLSFWLAFLKNYKNIGIILIITNGTILPSTEQIESLKHDERIVVAVSDYGLPTQKISSLINILNNKNIKNVIRCMRKWDKIPPIIRHHSTINELKYLMSTCFAKVCHQIKDGKLWLCPFAANLAALKVVPDKFNEYVDLLDVESTLRLKESIETLFSLPYLKVCDFCGGRQLGHSSITVPAAIQIEQPLTIPKQNFT